MRKAMLLIAATATLYVGVLHIALPAAEAQVRGNNYGMSGCGLGSLVFQNDQDRVKQVLSSTTNGTFGSQTFGISSGTLNCNPGGSGASAALFIEVNREVLAKDMSRGSGETIDSLATIMGCSDSKAVGAVLQQNFDNIFPQHAVTSDEVTNSIFDTIKRDTTLSGSCKSLS